MKFCLIGISLSVPSNHHSWGEIILIPTYGDGSKTITIWLGGIAICSLAMTWSNGTRVFQDIHSKFPFIHHFWWWHWKISIFYQHWLTGLNIPDKNPGIDDEFFQEKSLKFCSDFCCEVKSRLGNPTPETSRKELARWAQPPHIPMPGVPISVHPKTK